MPPARARRLAPALLLALWACAPRAPLRAPEAAWPDPPPAAASLPAPLEIPEGRAERAARLLESLRDAAVRRDTVRAEQLVSGGNLLSSSALQLVELVTSREHKFRIEPLAPAGDGLFVRLVVIRGLYRLPSQGLTVYAGPDGADGEWRLFPAGPRDATRATLVAETTRVRLDPAARRLEGRAELTVRTGGERWIPLELDAAHPEHEEDTGFEVRGVDVDGKPARWQVVFGAGTIVVAIPEGTGPEARVRVVWDGRPGAPFNFIEPDELLLHEADPWFPVLPSTSASFDLVLEFPRTFEIVAEGFAGEPPRDLGEGLRAVRVRFHSDRGTTLFGASSYATRTTALDGIPVRIAVKPDLAPKLDAMLEDLRATWRALAPLGKLPSNDLRLVDCRTPPGVAAVGGRSFLGLSRQGLERKVIAHELAHSWFGGTIPSTFRGDWGGQWPESLAEYVVVWTYDDPAEARALRREWSECYSRYMGAEGPLRSARNVAGAERPLLYCKGPLVLAGLERRIGRETMRAALASFVAARAGKPSSWEDLADAVGATAGAPHAAWLREQLSRPVEPALVLEDVAVGPDEITATLVQFVGAENPRVLDVELVLTGADGETLGEKITVRAETRRTPVRLAHVGGAAGIAIDPEFVLPWKYKSPESRRVPLPSFRTDAR